jgi:deoxyribose-phosphate aldolase
MTPEQLASRIDHTLLKPEAQRTDIDRVIDEAIRYRFASVCTGPVWIRHVASRLMGTGIKACSVVGFPHGNQKPVVKAIEATSAIKDGADEIDIVANLAHLLRDDLDAARDELLEIVRAARAARRDVVIKVIVESALLMQNRDTDAQARTIQIACQAVQESACDYIKTSTGFHPAGGASLEAVRLMKKYGTAIKVKASGGIRDLPTAIAMLDSGADRLGLSASTAIVDAISMTQR